MTVDDPTLEAARANAEAMIRDEPAITLERFAPDAFVDTSITIVLGSDPLELIAAAAAQIATWKGTPPLRVVADHEVYLSQPAVLTDVVVSPLSTHGPMTNHGGAHEHTARSHTPGVIEHAHGYDLIAAVRVDDFQIVTAQALRSRGRFNDPALWDDLRERLMLRAHPHAILVGGSDSRGVLLVLLNERRPGRRQRTRSWPTTLPAVHGEIAIVQPGLSRSEFLSTPAAVAGTTANSLHQLFGVVADTVAVTGNRAIVLGSP